MLYHVAQWVKVFIFLIMQKTAYEVRIKDLGSDVCSSDLVAVAVLAHQDVARAVLGDALCRRLVGAAHVDQLQQLEAAGAADRADHLSLLQGAEIGRASCRERVCQYV